MLNMANAWRFWHSLYYNILPAKHLSVTRMPSDLAHGFLVGLVHSHEHLGLSWQLANNVRGAEDAF